MFVCENDPFVSCFWDVGSDGHESHLNAEVFFAFLVDVIGLRRETGQKKSSLDKKRGVMKIDTNISNALVLIEEIMQLSGMYTKPPRNIGIFTTNLN